MYNKVILIGRLVAAPELHKTSTDKSVARVTVAVNRRYKDQNGERETDFVNVVVWGKLAETIDVYKRQVLESLNEIAPHFVDPVQRKPIRQLWDAVK